MWAVCSFAAAWHVASAASAAYVTSSGRTTAEIPLSYRALLPLRGIVRPAASARIFSRQRARLDSDIIAAGLEGAVTGEDIVALRFLCPLVEGTVFAGLFRLFVSIFPGTFADGLCTPLSIAVAVLLFFSPAMWVRGALKRRHKAIARALPFMLDMLTLSVEAGMDFMAALQRGCKIRRQGPLEEELMRMMHETQLGTPRRKALKEMAERVRQPDLKSVASALVQADELGVSIGSMLRILSDQMRARRFERAEKLANEAPVKMLGPLMLCIFPAVFIILLGPVMAQAAQGLF